VTAARAAIIFPCRNESATIRGCLEEVRQKRPDWDIVVADNGSTDDSARIAIKAGARVVVEGRPGYGAALKCGLAAADGVWLLYADADSTYCLEHCAELLAAAIEADADLIIASRYGRVAPGTPAAGHRGIQPGGHAMESPMMYLSGFFLKKGLPKRGCQLPFPNFLWLPWRGTWFTTNSTNKHESPRV
jgi:glycosyltransferase involved in cell wall biosynthesis